MLNTVRNKALLYSNIIQAKSDYLALSLIISLLHITKKIERLQDSGTTVL